MGGVDYLLGLPDLMLSHSGPCYNDVPAIFGAQVEIFSLPQKL